MKYCPAKMTIPTVLLHMAIQIIQEMVIANIFLKATDVVTWNDKLLKTVLGGTGLAISSQCEHKDQAVAFAKYAASPEIQKTLFFDNGGQPGHRAAWTDTETNRRCIGFL